jgi:hypothetical protein
MKLAATNIEIRIGNLPSLDELISVWNGNDGYTSHDVVSLDDYFRLDWRSTFEIYINGVEVFQAALDNLFGSHYDLNISNIWHQWIGVISDSGFNDTVVPFYPVSPIDEILSFRLMHASGAAKLGVYAQNDTIVLAPLRVEREDLLRATATCREHLILRLKNMMHESGSPVHFESLEVEYFLPSSVNRTALSEGNYLPGTRVVRVKQGGIVMEAMSLSTTR